MGGLPDGGADAKSGVQAAAPLPFLGNRRTTGGNADAKKGRGLASPAFCEPLMRRWLVQPRHVLRNGLDLALRHTERYTGHDAPVADPAAGLERQQLFLRVGGILAGDLREARRNAVPRR